MLSDTNGGEQQATDALRRTLGQQARGPQGEDLVRCQIREMSDSLALSRAEGGQRAGEGSSAGGQGVLLLEPRFRRPLLIGTSIMLFQQVGPDSRGYRQS